MCTKEAYACLHENLLHQPGFFKIDKTIGLSLIHDLISAEDSGAVPLSVRNMDLEQSGNAILSELHYPILKQKAPLS